jgi:hypothetical protein
MSADEWMVYFRERAARMRPLIEGRAPNRICDEETLLRFILDTDLGGE